VLINTEVKYNYRRVYRLIGRHLYSARTVGVPLDLQEYVLERPDVVEPELADADWQVEVRSGRVYLKR
jgi:hypothetical protein